MFENIASKIKIAGKAVGIIGTFLSFCLAISIWSEERGYFSSMIIDDEQVVTAGMIVLLVGTVLSILSCLLIYGFGQLIENSEQLINLKEENSKVIPNNDAKVVLDDSVVNFKCPHCSEELSYEKDYIKTNKNIQCPEQVQ